MQSMPKSNRRAGDRGYVIAPARNGRGLFATRRYRPGETLMKVEGRVVDADLLWERGGAFASNCYRFGPETYLDPGDHVSRYVNHACAPNVGLRKENNQLFLFIADPVRAGAELLLDYSTTLGDDDIWTMRCNCGAANCRRTVRRFGSLPREVKSDVSAARPRAWIHRRHARPRLTRAPFVIHATQRAIGTGRGRCRRGRGSAP